MAYLLIEGAGQPDRGGPLRAARRSGYGQWQGKVLDTRRATFAYAFLWGTAAAGSVTLALANLAALLGVEGLDDFFSAASALIWSVAVIPFFYICGYLILHSQRSARVAAACGAVMFGLGVWLAYNTPFEAREVAYLYFINVFEGPMVQAYVLCVVLLPGVVASFLLYRLALRLEGIGRWRSLMGMAAMDVYLLALLLRVVWQALPANLISRLLLLVTAVLIFLAYYAPPGGPEEDGKHREGLGD